MSGALLRHLLVPVANADDAEATSAALAPYLGAGTEHVTLLHVVEQTPGFMDHTSPEALEEEARAFLEAARERLGQAATVETAIRFGTDLVEEIADQAREEEATAIAFHPREKGQLTKLLTEDAERRLLRESTLPVVALPDADADDA